ncbi:hypothetical protein OAK24_00890 [Flavobacteriales bacterium]|nr:hypothetical protein [Flavobacteriales bacterium]
MRRRFKFFLLLFPICSVGQITTFYTAENILYSKDVLNKTTSYSSDTTQQISIAPRLFGVSTTSNNRTYNSCLLGVHLLANIGRELTIIANYDQLEGDPNSLITDYLDSLAVYPAFSAKKRRFQFNMKYNLNKFFTVDVGKGTHFIGNGYRSFLLSTEHSPYPYFKLTTKFGRVRYYNLYTTFLDIQESNQHRKKHSSIHFLDFTLTKNINIGVFEGVLWQAKDEDYTRGYDVEYLNPVIFFRPVEFSKHSPDNVLMGATLNATFNTTTFYSQILLDDLNISRQKDRDDEYSGGFFQNKFAYQLGFRSFFKGVNVLLEYNQSQPYTYAHKEPMQSYTHMNQSLAHPCGANFKEMVLLADYSTEKWKYSVKLTLANLGLDSVDTHYGQNIFVSDFDAQGDGEEYSYGNFNGQGVLTQLNTVYTEISYSLKWFDVFGSVFYRKQKSDLIDQTSLFYSLGIRTFPFSVFTDY